MDQEAPAQSIELDNVVQESISSLGENRPPHNVGLDPTPTEPNHVAVSDQFVTETSVASNGTGIRKIFRQCSSQRMGVVFGFLALVIAIYSYYGQYQLSWKTWELGLWKDCRDLDLIADSNTCHRYQNVTYDQIATRDLKSTSTITLPHPTQNFGFPTTIKELLKSKTLLVVRAVAPILDCFVLIGWLFAVGAVIFHVLIFVSDMTSGHDFPYQAYLAVYVLINTSVATIMCSHTVVKTICGCLSILNVFRHFTLVKSALVICVEARHNPSTKSKWERNSISGLICTPYIHTFTTGLIIFQGHVIAAPLLPKALLQSINTFFTASCVSLFIFFVLLSITQNLILRTENRFAIDFEAQSSTIIEVSHKDMLLSRAEAVPGRLRNRWASSSANKNTRLDIEAQ